ncbi:hypothetical protein CPB86DRAFT_754686 [Serendipita vermifera]|nr:hypothetical protein CPB86DRAFT_754686 [Serendipita vermifera]
MHVPTQYSNVSDAPWPQSLRSHPIFDLSEEVQQPTNPITARQRRSRVLFRNSDLLVAVNNQIRITSLLDAKLPKASRTYKTLHAPNVQFIIEQMALNADGRLLAVAGSHHLAVIVLPSSGRGGRAPTIECKSIQIAPYYHGNKGSAKIVKIEWHPLGHGNTSLFVLTADGVLREYDPTEDAEEPLQTFNFVLKKKKRNTFTMDNSDSSEAISFSFGCGQRDTIGARGCSDWTPLTVYGLMKGGDIYALCPVCPSRMHVDAAFLRSLEAYVRGKEALALQDSSIMNSPTPAFHLSTSFASSTSSTVTSTLELDLPTIYDHQRKYISTLTKELPQEESAETPAPSGLFKESSLSSFSTQSVASTKTRSNVSQPVTVNAPNTIKLEVEAQGPFRFQPAPAPSSAPDWDEIATDIFYSTPNLQGDRSSNDKLSSIGILMVAFADGRVDVCLDLIKVEAVWTRPGAPPHSPLLVVIETIDLDFISYFRPVTPQYPDSSSKPVSGPSRPVASALQPLLTSAPLHPRFMVQNYVSLIPDPIYGDTVYLYHSFGVHAIWFGWLKGLQESLASSLSKSADESFEVLQEFVSKKLSKDHREASTVVQMLDTVDVALRTTFPIIGFTVSSDIYIDYSMLSLTSNHQVVPVELQIRFPDPQPDSGPSKEGPGALGQSTDFAKSSDHKDPQPLAIPSNSSSYLSNKPFTGLPHYRPPNLPPVPKIILGRNEANPTELRQFAAAVAGLSEYHKVIQTLPAILEERVELLNLERNRQIQVVKQLRSQLERIAGKGTTGGGLQRLIARTERAHQVQPMLVKRLDWLLQRLMDTYNGALTDGEKAWFRELKRMRKDVAYSADGNSLLSRADLLSKQLAILSPDLHEIKEKEEAMKQQQNGTDTLGTRQMLDLGRQLGSEEIRVKEAVQKMKELAARMGITNVEPPVDEE